MTRKELYDLEYRLPELRGFLRTVRAPLAAARRKRILREAPDVLLTTPESIEAMLVRFNVDHRRFFGGVRVRPCDV